MTPQDPVENEELVVQVELVSSLKYETQEE